MIKHKIFKAIALISIIIMMISYLGKEKIKIIKEFRETNVIIKINDIGLLFTYPSSEYYHEIELINLKFKTKFNIPWFSGRYYFPEQYIYDEFIPLYVLKEYIYDKSIGNNFEEIENTINQYLIDSDKKFNLEKWNNPKMYVFIAPTNKERNHILYFNLYCYVNNDGKIEEVEDDVCYDVKYNEKESENISYLREVINKYIPNKTRYDKINFSNFFEEYNKEPIVSINLYNPNIKTEEQLEEVADFFEKGGYLEKIRKNYNNDKIIIKIYIKGNYINRIRL